MYEAITDSLKVSLL